MIKKEIKSEYEQLFDGPKSSGGNTGSTDSEDEALDQQHMVRRMCRLAGKQPDLQHDQQLVSIQSKVNQRYQKYQVKANQKLNSVLGKIESKQE